MRCISVVALCWIGGCGGLSRGGVPTVLESFEWPAYIARHVTEHTTRGEDPLHGARWERSTVRRERYSERIIDGGVQRTYEEFEITEKMRIESERSESHVGSPLIGQPLWLVRVGDLLGPGDESARSVIGEHTRFGPPRLRTQDNGEWAIEDGPLLYFLGQGAYESGSLHAEIVERRRIQLKILETYERGTISGQGWMIFDFEAGLVTRMEVSGEIVREDGQKEPFRTTRTWSTPED